MRLVSKPMLIIAIVVLAGLFTAAWYFTRPLGTAEFALAPHTATLTINSKSQSVQSGQKMSLAPGTYSFEFSRDGFAGDNTSVTITEGKSTRVVMALAPQTEAAKAELASDQQAAAIIKEYADIRFAALIASLPLTGVNYSINSCPSVKQPNVGKKALCITATTPATQAAALTTLRQAGYNPDQLEIMMGSDTVKTILQTSSYKVEYYTNTQIEGATKLALFITPIGTPYVSYSVPSNPQLEAIRTSALADLKQHGYPVDDYSIFYSDAYLARYNPNNGSTDEHFLPPNYSQLQQ